MSTFDDDIHTHDSRLLGMYVGYVTKRDDEEQLGPKTRPLCGPDKTPTNLG